MKNFNMATSRLMLLCAVFLHVLIPECEAGIIYLLFNTVVLCIPHYNRFTSYQPSHQAGFNIVWNSDLTQTSRNNSTAKGLGVLTHLKRPASTYTDRSSSRYLSNIVHSVDVGLQPMYQGVVFTENVNVVRL